MKSSIIVVGSINMDLVVHAPRLPQLGETILGRDFHTYPGGKGANQATTCARLGAKVSMIGRVGKDQFGKELLGSMNESGVEVSAVMPDENRSSGVALITVVEDGDNTIIVSPGANGSLTSDDVVRQQSKFKEAAVVVLQLEIPLMVIETAIQLAKENGVKVVLNPAPAQSLSDSVLQQIDYLIPNQTELSRLTGKKEISEGVANLRSRGIANVIVTLGGDGVFFLEDSKLTHFPAYPVQVVDTTAAGDAFVGAFAVGLSENQTLAEAVRWGNAAGALAVTKAGAQPSLPHRDELMNLLHLT